MKHRIRTLSLTAWLAALILALASICNAAPPPTQPTLSTPTTSDVGAGMATLNLQSNATGTGYFTLLNGNSAPCGSGSQVKAGQDSGGALAPYRGSRPLVADTVGLYTIRNLSQSSDYTICFTADDGATLQETPATATLSTTAMATVSGASWNQVGGNVLPYLTYKEMAPAVAPDGTLHMAYLDYNDYQRMTVRKYDGSSWVTVGNSGFSSPWSYCPSLVFAPDGTPYVSVYTNTGAISVLKFTGVSWTLVGTAGFASAYPDNAYDSLSLAIAPDGTPYVAFKDYNGSPYRATVMKYTGAAWVAVGSARFSTGEANHLSLAIDPTGTPYLAYVDSGYSGKALVKMFNGASWLSVGLSSGFSSAGARYTSLALAPDGTPYVAYADGSNDNRTTVMMYNGSGWIAVGNTAASGGSQKLVIAPDGTPMVAFGAPITVMKYDGANWSTLGSLSPNNDSYYGVRLALAPDGAPYAAYSLFDPFAVRGKAIVRRLVPTKASSSTTVATNANPAPVGTSVTFTATVSPAAAIGSVTFKDGAATLGTGTLSGGIATYSTTSLTVGDHSITAVYGGDSSYNGSTSTAITQTITKATSSTALVSSLNPSTEGQSITFTATVTPTGLTGSVDFKDNGSIITGCEGMTISSDQATCTTSALAVGSHPVTAVYSGNSSNNGSTSPAITQIVNLPGLTLTTSVLPEAYLKLAYNQTLTATGGTGPYTWSITSKTKLPKGLALNAVTGVISGAPTVVVTNSSITFQVKDSLNATAEKSIPFTVLVPPDVSTTILATGAVGVPYSQTLVGKAGKPPYTWSLVDGSSLPPGLTMSSAGVISGTPTAAGRTSFFLKVTDVNGITSKNYGPLGIRIYTP